jgi:hypothetical protein
MLESAETGDRSNRAQDDADEAGNLVDHEYFLVGEFASMCACDRCER